MAAKTIYVGNLEWSTTEYELNNFFAPYGKVYSAQILKDKETGRSRGFGFVSMEDADKAMLELNGKELRGRSLKLNEARDKVKKPSSSSPHTGDNY